MSRIAKLDINGKLIEYDFDHRPMLEALLVEKVTGMRYADWEDELVKGSVKAMVALVWLALRRDGENVEYEALIGGEYDVDLTAFLLSMQEFGEQLKKDKAEAEQPFPTGASLPSDQAGTPATSRSTKRSSPSSTASGRGRSAS